MVQDVFCALQETSQHNMKAMMPFKRVYSEENLPPQCQEDAELYMDSFSGEYQSEFAFILF